MKTLLISIDLNTIRLTSSMLKHIVDDMSENFEIFQIRLYNFVNTRHSELKLFNNTKVFFSDGGKRKVQLDIYQALDSLHMALTSSINAIFLLCGNVGISPLLSKLKELNIDIILTSLTDNSTTPYNLNRSLNCDLTNMFLNTSKIASNINNDKKPIANTDINVEQTPTTCADINMEQTSIIEKSLITNEKQTKIDTNLQKINLKSLMPINDLLTSDDLATSKKLDAIKNKLDDMLAYVNYNKLDALKNKYEQLIKKNY